MADNKFATGPGALSGSCRETVCIETNRIMDACRDRDCYENARAFLTECGNDILDRTNDIRVKSAAVDFTTIRCEPVQFSRGFYTVHIRFFCRLDCEACIGGGRSQEFDCVCALDKRVILYGGESNVNVFRSSPDTPSCGETPLGNQSRNVPEAVVEVVDPVVLGCQVMEEYPPYCPCACCDVPGSVVSRIGSALNEGNGRRYLAVSLGIFSVVRLVRPCQYLVQGIEYNIPDKECVAPMEEDPCSVFRTMAFPTAEFSPPSIGADAPSLRNGNCNGGNGRTCGCGN